MFRRILLTIALGSLSGCGTAPALQTASNIEIAKNTAVSNCKDRFGARKEMMPVTDCITQAQVDFYRPMGGDWLTIALEERAETLRWASDVDSGKIKGPAAKAELDAIGARAQSRRQALSSQVAQAQQQQSDALFAAGAAMMAPPPTVTCSTVLGDPVVRTTTCR
jgi:hypothetical protein